jgi:integrase
MEGAAEKGVYKRDDHYVVTFRDQDGRPRKEIRRTFAEARALKAQRRAEVKAGAYEAPSALTFRQYAEEWIDRYEGKRGVRDSTREEYRRALDNHAIPHFGSMRLTAIKPRDVAAYVGTLAGAPGTQANALKPVKALLRTAVEEGLVPHNPAREIVIAQPQRIEEDEDEEVRALSREQLALILEITPTRHRTLFELLATTGLRISEALALQWKHVELDGARPHVKVRRAYVRGNYHPPKSKRGRREVALPRELVNELRARRPDGEVNEVLVFPNRDGAPLNDKNLRRRILKPLCQEAGASWVRGFHVFRHGYASMQIANGVKLVPLSRALGHHSAAFTLSVYAQLLDGDEAPALELPPVDDSGQRIGATRATESGRDLDPAELLETAA